MANRVIDAVLRLRDEFTQPMSKSLKLMTSASKEGARVRKQIDRMGKSITDVGAKMTTAFTVPIVGAGVAAVKHFSDVDSVMRLANKTMGNTEEEARLLTDAMKAAAAQSVFGMSDASNAVLNFARAGLKAEEAAAAVAPAMNLAAGEGGNLDTVSAGLVATINGFADSFDQTGHYADVFAAACNNSALDVDTLSNAMSVAAPIFASAGYKVEDAALMMGVMANNGIDANVAANSLKTGLARLVSPAKEGAEMMEKLGISITNADGTMKGTTQIQQELNKTFGELSESEQIAAASAIFGKNQMAPWLALINTAPDDVTALSNSLSDCGGTTQEMADTMMGGLGGAIEQIKSNLDVLSYSFGERLAPYVQKAADKIKDLTVKFNELSPEQQDQIIKIAGIVAAIGPCIMIFGKLVSGVSKVSGAFSTINGIFMSVSKSGGMLRAMWAALSSPMGIAIGVIAALIAIIAIVITHIDQFKEAAGTLMDAVGPSFEGLKTAFGNLWNEIQPVVELIGDVVANFLVGAISGAAESIGLIFDGITTVIQGVADVFGGVVETITNLINGDFDAAWESAKRIVTGAVEIIGGLIEGIAGAISGMVGAISGGIGKVADFFGGKNGADSKAAKVAGAANTVTSAVKGAAGATSAAARASNSAISAKGAYKGYDSKAAKQMFTQASLIGSNASGTDNWRGGLTRINERGGEIIDLPRGTRIWPHDESVEQARQAGNITIAKLADSIVVREDADIDRIANAITRKIQLANQRRGGYSYSANMA